MLKCTITIPVENPLGQPFIMPDNVQEAVDGIVDEFGNCTVFPAIVQQTGRDARSILCFVYVNPIDAGRLRDAVAEICRTLGLDSIRFERSLSSVEDIDPAEVVGPAKSQDELPTPGGRASDDGFIEKLSRGTPPTIGQATKRAEEAFLAPDILPPEIVTGPIVTCPIPGDCAEIGGELSVAMVAKLKSMGFEVLLYSQRGVVSTVIRSE